jgi:hypothetical protein
MWILTGSVRRLRTPLALVAIFALWAMVAPTAVAQDEDETGVECDAELLVFEDEEEIEEIYLVDPGDEVDCVAFGLDPEGEGNVSWNVLIAGISEDDEDMEEEQGEDGLTAEEDGTLAFTFTVPEEIMFGFLEGVVIQADEGEDPTFEEEFFGFIGPFFFEGEMTCEPDPVEQGQEVECIAEDMAPDEDFTWEVHFFTLREMFDDLFGDGPDEGDIEDSFEPDVEGDGTADADGLGAFAFEVPTDRAVDVYFALALQDEFFALYIGAACLTINTFLAGRLTARLEAET